MRPREFFKKVKGKDRMMLVIFTGIIILLIYFISSSHYLTIQRIKEETLSRLMVVANMASLLIDGDEHEYLSNRYRRKNDLVTVEQDSIYFKINKTLQLIKSQNDILSPIYTMVYNDSTNEFEFIVTSASMTYYRHMYKHFPEQLKENFNNGGVLYEYQSENGTWLSAFAPIKNSKGEVVAVVQTDENIDDFYAEANRELLKNIAYSLILFIPFSFFLFNYMNATLKKEERNKKVLLEQNEEIQSQNELIKNNNIKLERAYKLIEKQNRNLDRMVLKRTRQLEMATNDLETFLYRSSHDIQGPIASLKGVVNMAKIDKDNIDQYFNHVDSAVKQLDLRVRGINSVFEIKRNNLNLKKIELADFVKKAIENQKIINSCEELSCEIDIDPTMNFNSDEKVLDVIFSELSKNSILYQNGEMPKIKISMSEIGQKHIRIDYRDNSLGIHPSQKNDVFKMFKRGNEKSEGSGLGLYAVRYAAEKLHGKVGLLDSNKGVSFEIFLPRL